MAVKEQALDFKTSTVIYDSLAPKMQAVSKNKIQLAQLLKEITKITDKNANVLQTNIVGTPLIVNDMDQSRIFSAIGLTQKEVTEICLSSPRLDGVGKIIDQFSFAVPLLLLSGALHKSKQDLMAQTIFKFIYFRPYASKVKTFFTMGTVDETAMNYTVNIALTDKSYIHKYGTVMATLEVSASSTYDAFINNLGNQITDDLLYNNVFYSAIFSKTGSWIKSLYGTYKEVKASGKALKYEQSFYTSLDDDTGDDQVDDSNIQSDSAVKRSVVGNAITKFNISPVDSKYITFASRYAFAGNKSELYENYISQAVYAIANSKSEHIPAYFDAIVSSYLDTPDSNGNKRSSKSIKSIQFLEGCKKNFVASRFINSNISEIKNLTKFFLMECSPKYNSSGATQKSQLEKGLFYYFVIYIQKT